MHRKIGNLALAGLLAMALTGCLSIHYQVKDQSIPVAFSSSQKAYAGTMDKEGRTYFIILGLMRANDLLPMLGTGLEGAIKEGAYSRGFSLSDVEIIEELGLLDYALAVVGGMIPVVNIIYSGSRTTAYKAQVRKE